MPVRDALLPVKRFPGCQLGEPFVNSNVFYGVVFPWVWFRGRLYRRIPQRLVRKSRQQEIMATKSMAKRTMATIGCGFTPIVEKI